MSAENIQPFKLNLGSASKRFPGFTNVDIRAGENVDIVWDLTQVPYPKRMENADEILAQEFLEHISFWKTEAILREWFRILKPGGKLVIQVPDAGKMCEYYANGQVCECIPHKPMSREDAAPDPNCWNCRGKGKVNPTRWLYAFCGAQKHPFDFHRNIFTKDLLEKPLKKAGFKDVKINSDVYEWKLIATCIKEKNEDTSNNRLSELGD